MRKAVPASKGGSQDKVRTPEKAVHKPQHSQLGTGRLAQLAAMANRSSGVQAQQKLAAELQGSNLVQTQLKVAEFISPGLSAAAQTDIVGGDGSLVVQRRIGLKWFNEELKKKSKGADLSEETLSRLGGIQELLGDPQRVLGALQSLEDQVKAYKDKGLRPTQALNFALQDVEKTWMLPGRVKVTSSEIARQHPKGPQDKKSIPYKDTLKVGATLPPQEFVKEGLGPLKALKDVGAVPAHGEYAHRLQWYIIHHGLSAQFGKEIAGKKGEAFDPSKKYGESELLHLYALMANPDRVVNNPDQETDISLWDAVLDARGSWVYPDIQNDKQGADKKVRQAGSYHDVGFGAPAFLTTALVDPSKVDPESEARLRSPQRAENKEGYTTPIADLLKRSESSAWPKLLPTISEAVTKRKAKRIKK